MIHALKTALQAFLPLLSLSFTPLPTIFNELYRSTFPNIPVTSFKTFVHRQAASDPLR